MTHKRDERAAVAVTVGILATLLFSVAALSVDLGNAWARQRSLQTQVDITAMSAGWKLPADTAALKSEIRDDVADYLNEQLNYVHGQPDVSGTSDPNHNGVTGAELGDGSTSNGEVIFIDDYTMRVVSPAADVNFLFATVMGLSDTDVHADATVQIQSSLPPMQEVLPFALPSGCPYGSGMADTGPGPAPTADPGPDFVPANGDTGNHIVGTVTPASTQINVSASVTIPLDNLPIGSTTGTVEFRLGTTTVHPVTNVNLASPATTSSDDARSPSVSVPAAVISTAGQWKVWFRTGNNNKYSTNAGSFEVIDPAAGPLPVPGVDCSGSEEGNYGQLDSPRDGVTQLGERFALNIATGLDHLLVPHQSASADVCADNSGHNLIADAVLDEEPSPTDVPFVNCVGISTGNDGPKVMQGLITGVGSVKGRLDASFGTTTDLNGCAARSDVTVNGVVINNDVLSCYLLGSTSLTDLTSTSTDPDFFEGMLDPSITKSPRFVWIPVLYSDERINDKWQPVERFVPGLITSETQTESADTDNGVVTNGNSVESLQVFTFNPLTLPPNEQSPSMAYDPAEPPILRLID